MDNKVTEGVDEGTTPEVVDGNLVGQDHPLRLGNIFANAGVSDAYRIGVDGICGITPDQRNKLDSAAAEHLEGIRTETVAQTSLQTAAQIAKRFE